MIRWATTFVLAALLLGAYPAHAGTIVFDFEDGLQGWELRGAVQRVQTQLLGGEWAIFGDGLVDNGSAVLSIGGDFSNVSMVTVEQHFVEGDLGEVQLLALVEIDIIEGLFVGEIRGFPLVSASPGQNPALLGADLRRLAGEEQSTLFGLNLTWTALPEVQRIDDPDLPPGPPPSLVAFIDNITFHTIPEPSVLGMLALGGLTLIRTRRQR